MMTLADGANVVFVALLLLAAWLDISTRRLPNWLCGLVALSGIIATFALDGPLALGMAAIHAIIALLVCALLFRIGMIGGGDAKFYAAVAFWFPLGLGLKLLLGVSLTGFVLLLTFVIVRRVWQRIKGKLEGDYAKLPYGVAIAGGAIAARLLVV